MALHFLHIGKTGGTAVKHALRRAGFATWDPEKALCVPETPYGQIRLHKHSFRLSDVPLEDYVFFSVRDPISLFVSGFYSRLNKGQPRHYYEWSDDERRAFEAFPTPQLLAGALAADDEEVRRRAQWAMRHIRHLRSIRRILGGVPQLRARRRQIVYIARQETLGDDWEQMRVLLGLGEETALPSGRVRAHRRDPSLDTTLDDVAVRALREWYAHEYRILEYCDDLRRWHGWGTGTCPSGIARLRLDMGRFGGFRAVLPPRVANAAYRARTP